MSRDFFQKAQPGFVGPCGSIISSIQSTLNELAPSKIPVDGIFGGMTTTALSAFQGSHGLKTSGIVSDETWTALMHTTEPDIFARCLQVTASFEGTGFTHVVGNFDGAGITWGIIGFTLMNGELGTLLSAINQTHPSLMARAFGDDVKTVLQMTGPSIPNSDKQAWADSVSRGTNKLLVADPWNTYFRDLGAMPEVQQLQINRARDKYWGIARDDLQALAMREELDCLLLFDTAVQNGGLSAKGRLNAAQAAFSQQGATTSADKRRIVAQIVADTASSAYRQDVLTRKMGIAVGTGTIHGGKYELSNWGFLNGYSPCSI